MRILLLILLATALVACASNVLVFDPTSTPVPGRARAYLVSVNTTDFEGVTNALINPALPGVALEWVKVTNGTAVAMSLVESNLVVSTESSNRLAGARSDAKNGYDADHPLGRLQRAIVEITMREINILRTNAGLAARTPSQLRTAIRNELDAQP